MSEFKKLDKVQIELQGGGKIVEKPWRGILILWKVQIEEQMEFQKK